MRHQLELNKHLENKKSTRSKSTCCHDRPHTLTLAHSSSRAATSQQVSPTMPEAPCQYLIAEGGYPQHLMAEGSYSLSPAAEISCCDLAGDCAAKKSSRTLSEDMMHYVQDLSKSSSQLASTVPSLNDDHQITRPPDSSHNGDTASWGQWH